jgi:predicted Rossmann-fold nucleotide-binding protein
MPGGFGTVDELFEALTLIQTRKVRYFPLVLMGCDYWQGLLDWMRDKMLADGKIGPQDLPLMRVTDDPEEVVELVSAAADLRGWAAEPGRQPDET